MHCHFCHHTDTKVIDSRLAEEGYTVRRRRECPKCNARFTTFEVMENILPQVVKSDNRREPFDLNKLRNGLARALEKRPVPVATQDQMIEQILSNAYRSGEREIPSRRIGEWVMDSLREVDEIAYVRFASVYLSFQDLNAFRTEIERLENERRKSNH